MTGLKLGVERYRDLNVVLGRVIAERRESLGLTQEQVWTAVGQNRNSYRRLEYGQREVTAELLKQVASVLETHAWSLLQRAETGSTLVETGPAPRQVEQQRDATTNLGAELGFE
jgi:transcriptional regulator with XRE-family HTH domain